MNHIFYDPNQMSGDAYFNELPGQLSKENKKNIF